MIKPACLLSLCSLAVVISGCQTKTVEVVNGMAVEKDCDAIVSRQGSSHKITLPSVSGLSGVTLNLGSFETDPQTTAKITDQAVTYEDQLVYVCSMKKEAAYGNQPDVYKRWQDLELANFGKLQDLNAIIASHPATPANEGGAETAANGTGASPPKPSGAKAAASSSAKGKGKPKTKPQMLASWLNAYGSASAALANKGDVRFIQSQEAKSASAVQTSGEAVGSAPPPPPTASAGPAPAAATLLAIPRRAPSYFGLQ